MMLASDRFSATIAATFFFFFDFFFSDWAVWASSLLHSMRHLLLGMFYVCATTRSGGEGGGPLLQVAVLYIVLIMHCVHYAMFLFCLFPGRHSDERRRRNDQSSD